MTDLKNYTVKQFATLINENNETIKKLITNNQHTSYAKHPFENIVIAVEKSNIKTENIKIVSKFIYTCIFNNNLHRFYR